MSRSTFSGPVIVGVDASPTYQKTTDRVEDNPDWGFVNMVQSAAITETYDNRTTSIVIPNKSTITRVSVLVTTAWSGTTTLDIGTYWGEYTGPDVVVTLGADKDDLVNNLAVTVVGMVVAGPGDTDDLTGSDIDNWMRMPKPGETYDNDRVITYDTEGTVASEGVGILTVEYCQAVDLSAIA